MMGIANIIFFILLTSFVAVKADRSFSRTLPISTVILVFVLLILAIMNKLNWIDYISIFVSIVLMLFFIKKRKALKGFVPEILAFLGLIAVLVLLCKNHVTYFADELRYWGLETKTIYYLNGFGERGADAAYLYGNYHPGLVLFMWWFCHFSPEIFSEGLMFSGHWILFSIPIFCALYKKANWWRSISLFLLTLVTVLLVPSIVSAGYESIMVEYPMASCFALLLYENFQDKKQDVLLNSAIIIMMSFLKSVGFIWAIFVLILAYIRNGNKRQLLVGGFCGLTTCLIWRIYCFVMERNSYYSSDIIHTIEEMEWNGKRPFLIDLMEYAKSYFSAFTIKPLHQSSEALINITPLIFVVVFVLFIIIATRLNLFSVKDRKIILASYLTTQVIFSAVLIFLCTFVFRETLFKESKSLIVLIARYGANLYLGDLLFLTFKGANSFDSYTKKGQIVSAAILVLITITCADFKAVCDGFGKKEEMEFYTNAKKEEILSRYDDALSSTENEAVLVENVANSTLHDRYFFIQYVGAPKKLIVEQSTADDLEKNIEHYKTEYETENIFTYGF